MQSCKSKRINELVESKRPGREGGGKRKSKKDKLYRSNIEKEGVLKVSKFNLLCIDEIKI